MIESPAFTPAVRMTRVLGARVIDDVGRKLGVIDDVLLDTRSNKILAVVLVAEHFWGLSRDYRSVPWSSLSYDVHDQAYKLELWRHAHGTGWRRASSDVANRC